MAGTANKKTVLEHPNGVHRLFKYYAHGTNLSFISHTYTYSSVYRCSLAGYDATYKLYYALPISTVRTDVRTIHSIIFSYRFK